MYKNSFNVSSSIHFTSKSYINILPSAELLPTTLLPNQVYLYIYISNQICQYSPTSNLSNSLELAATRRFCPSSCKMSCTTCSKSTLELMIKKFVAKGTSRSYRNKTGTHPVKAQSDRAKDIDIPLLPSNHDLYRNTLYPHLWVYLDAYPLPE